MISPNDNYAVLLWRDKSGALRGSFLLFGRMIIQQQAANDD